MTALTIPKTYLMTRISTFRNPAIRLLQKLVNCKRIEMYIIRESFFCETQIEQQSIHYNEIIIQMFPCFSRHQHSHQQVVCSLRRSQQFQVQPLQFLIAKKNDKDIKVTRVYINLTQIKQMIFFLTLFQKYSLGLYAATLSIQKSNIMNMYQ